MEIYYCLNDEIVHIMSQIKEQIIIAHCSFEQNMFIYMMQLVSSVKVPVIIHFVNTDFKKLNTSERGFNCHSLVGAGAIYSINVTIMMEGLISFYEIKTHDSESRGQEEAGRMRRTRELFTRSTALKFVNALNKKAIA